jgi:hypothetical protein
VHKCSTLRDEKELRLLMLHTGDEKAFSPGPSRGVDLDVDLRFMIQGLRLAPRSAGWLHNLAQSLSERYVLTLDYTATISEAQVCGFKNANGCGFYNRPFAPVEELQYESLAEPPCT